MSPAGAASLLGRHLRVHRRRLWGALATDLAAPAACVLGLLLVGAASEERRAAGLLCATAALVAALEGSLGGFRRLRASAVGEVALASPLGLGELLAAELAFAGLRAGLAVGLLGLALRGLGWLEGAALGRALGASLLAGTALATWGLCAAALARGPEDLRAFLAGVLLPSLALSGAWFPPERAPAALQVLLWLNPLFHASALGGALEGEPGWLPLHAAAFMALAALPLWAAVRALGRRLAA